MIKWTPGTFHRFHVEVAEDDARSPAVVLDADEVAVVIACGDVVRRCGTAASGLRGTQSNSAVKVSSRNVRNAFGVSVSGYLFKYGSPKRTEVMPSPARSMSLEMSTTALMFGLQPSTPLIRHLSRRRTNHRHVHWLKQSLN